MRASMSRALVFAIALTAIALGGCSGSDDPPTEDPPTISLLSPEPETRARENLAVAGVASGSLTDVSVRLDAAEAVEATGLDEWFLLLDMSAVEDGSHTVTAIATDSEGRTAETLPMSFTSIANQPPDTAIWSGVVRDSDQQLLVGANVLVDGTSRSTLTDLNGRYAMVGLPRDQEALLVGSASGHVDTYMPRLLPTGDITLDIPLFKPAALDFIANEYGVTRERDKGTVIGFLLEQLPSQDGYAGATLALVGSSGDGPFYTTPSGDFDPGLTETSSSGVFVFFNVPSGPVAVEASGGGLSFNLLGSESLGESVTLLFGRAL